MRVAIEAIFDSSIWASSFDYWLAVHLLVHCERSAATGLTVVASLAYETVAQVSAVGPAAVAVR